jgi:beta-glucanase (GH16 family)
MLEEEQERRHGPTRRTGRTGRKSAIITMSVAVAAVAVIVSGLLMRANAGTDQTTADKLDNTADKTATVATLKPPAGWKLAFNSSFSGSKLKTSTWATCYPWAAQSGCTNFGNDGEEKEWYMPAQDKVKDGVLDLVAKRGATSGTNASGKQKEYECRSGMVTTFPGFKFEYGFVQVTAKIPFKKSLWPAFWLAASNEKWPPEIDLMEHWDADIDARVYLHPDSGIRQGGTVPTPGLSSGWHTFTVDWTKTRITWYYDGKQLLTTKVGVPHQKMYFIANLAVTSTSASSSCTGTLQIKSVKVWQPKS